MVADLMIHSDGMWRKNIRHCAIFTDAVPDDAVKKPFYFTTIFLLFWM